MMIHCPSRKSVSFSENSGMVFVPSLSTSPYKPNLWFTKLELKQFKSNYIRHIHAVRSHILSQGHLHTPNADDILGIEKFITHQLTGEYIHRRDAFMKKVLKEERRYQHHRQQQVMTSNRNPIYHDYDNVDRLAKASFENSQWARERARAVALFLERDQGF